MLGTMIKQGGGLHTVPGYRQYEAYYAVQCAAVTGEGIPIKHIPYYVDCQSVCLVYLNIILISGQQKYYRGSTETPF